MTGIGSEPDASRDGVAPVRWIHGGPVAERLELDPVGIGGTARATRRAAGPAPVGPGDDRGEQDGRDESDETPAPFAPIEEHALRALGRRGLSRRELGRRLAQAGYDADAVEQELDRLESTGLVDDFALAQHLVGTLQERKGLGRSGIAAELVRRVIAPAAIEYALDLIDTSEELALARDLAERRARSLRGLDPVTSERRLSAYLLRRGFSGSTVRAAIESVRSA